MGYGYKRVSSRQLSSIVERLTTPTRASISWRYDYDAQFENLKYLRLHDSRIHPDPPRSCTPNELGDIIDRLTRPTTASVAAVWNFDNQDANLAYLRIHDPDIELPFRTASVLASRRRCINVDDFVPSPSSAGRRRRQTVTSYGGADDGGGGGVGGKKTMTTSTLPQLSRPCGAVKDVATVSTTNRRNKAQNRHLSQHAYQYMANYDM